MTDTPSMASSSKAIGRKIAACLLSALALILAVPAGAQLPAPGYQFIEAVMDGDLEKATELLRNDVGERVMNYRDPDSDKRLVNYRNLTNGDFGLHIVVARRDLSWIRFLLENGADPNKYDRKDRSPLQVAVALGFVEGAEALIDGGASVDRPVWSGDTPLIAAVLARNVAMVRLLLAKGADPDRYDSTGSSARDIMEKMSGNTILKQEFAAADAKRAASGTKRR